MTVICSDKTGTLTENRMRAAILDVAERRVELADGARCVSTRGRAPELNRLPRADGSADTDLGLALLLAGGALCNDAVVEGEETDASTAWHGGRRSHGNRAGVRRRAGRDLEGTTRAPISARGRSAVRVRAEADDDDSSSCLPTRYRSRMRFGWRGAATTTPARR